ncbi:hypothetical protein ABZ905_36975 [Streptomyces parvus]|uniref:deoxynucleotide monophosphate kinase family protein n=1 Tax=Streptomyces parvus TaxID=66428 RepID=UPI0033FD19F0
MRDIALIGRARSGKDTVGARLVDRFGYTRLAFADPLKEMALEIDPVIPMVEGIHMRLSRIVKNIGWDTAKEHFPEVRRILQHTGQTLRDRDPNYWIHTLIRNLPEPSDIPVVVTDVRYANEADTLADHGFRLVRIDRPGVPEMSHTSETELGNIYAPIRIVNSGTIEDLYAHADTLPF